MKDKYKPAITCILFGALFLLPLLASIMAPVAPAGPATRDNMVDVGKIETAGRSSIFYPAYNTTTGGITLDVNNTYTDRLDRDIKFTVNATLMVQPGGWASAWGTDVSRCDLNITYPNSTSRIRTMTEIGGASSQIFSFTWRTNITLPNGTYYIRAIVWNLTQSYTWGFNFNPLTNVTLYNIDPVGSIAMNTTTVMRNGTLAFFISIFDPETPFPQLSWNVSIYKVNGTFPLKIYYKNDTLNQTYTFKGNDILGDYIFYVEIKDGSNGRFQETVSPFKVVNNPPVINSVHYNYTASLKRVTQSMRFQVNVTDPDNVKNFTSVRVILEHQPDTFFPEKLNLTNAPLLVYNATTKNFTGSITVPAGFPAGSAKIIVVASDNDPVPATSYYVAPYNNMTTIVNNLPTLNGVSINDRSLSAGLRFSTYNNLDFSINASDVENNILYVQVSLVSGATNITYFVLGKDLYKIRLPASALFPGSWGVFISVVDMDDGVLSSMNAGIIEVDPDLRDLTGYVIGGVLLVIAGFVIGGMVIWRYANERISAIRRDMLIKAKSKDAPEVKKGKPGDKTATSKYVEPPAKVEPEAKPEAKQPAKPAAAEKPAASKPFVGAQAPPSKGKAPAPEKKPDAGKPKAKQ
ncbi:MAG: hypothetical protein GYA24_02900 [Candidatus Lokiarchaeota archaeon]|nr:hypothetical protein [Candidatus Lokiarchaeota archaeon]